MVNIDKERRAREIARRFWRERGAPKEIADEMAEQTFPFFINFMDELKRGFDLCWEEFKKQRTPAEERDIRK